MFLLIHTMTITECNFVIQAQFFHTLGRNEARIEDAQLVGRRLSLRLHPNLRQNRQKVNLYRLNTPNLKTLMKRNSAHIRHHVRTIHIGSPGKSYALQNDVSPKYENNPTLSPASPTISGNIVTTVSEKRTISEDAKKLSQPLADVSNPEQTVCWLTANRFDKYIETFSSFSGADMLRMSREDFIQICGQADGIRLYNAIHLKAIAPKLTIYVSRESSNIFNAIFLSTHNNVELVQKLSSLACINQDQVRDVYIQGPQSIHILLSNDVVGRIKDESMFTLDVLQDNGSYVLLLKPTAK